MVKVVLLFSEQLQQLPAFGSTWRAILECLGSAMAGYVSEVWACMQLKT